MRYRRIAKFILLLPVYAVLGLIFLIAYSIMSIGEETSECSKDHKDS